MRLDVPLKAFRSALLLLLLEPGITFSLKGVHVDTVERLKKVQSLTEKRYSVAIGILGKHAKAPTACVFLIGLLLEKKVGELLVGCDKFARLLNAVVETGAGAIEHQLFYFSAFILIAERVEAAGVGLTERSPRPMNSHPSTAPYKPNPSIAMSDAGLRAMAALSAATV